MEFEINWSELKLYFENKSRNMLPQFLEFEKLYIVWGVEGTLTILCKIKKVSPVVEGSDQEEFETSYKAISNRPTDIVRNEGVKESNGMRARLKGIVDDTVPFNTSKDLDWKIENLEWLEVSKQSCFNGVEYFAENGKIGDTVTFQIVDKDGVLEGNVAEIDVVIEEFAEDFKVIPNIKNAITLYKGKLHVGLYVRIKYTSTSSDTAVRLICNLIRHLDENKNL